MFTIMLLAVGLALFTMNICCAPHPQKFVEQEGRVNSLTAMVIRYRALEGAYPTQAQGLLALHQEPKAPKPRMWTQTVAKMEDLNDVWGRPFQYRYPGKRNPSSFDVWSMGPDGISDNDDDIGN